MQCNWADLKPAFIVLVFREWSDLIFLLNLVMLMQWRSWHQRDQFKEEQPEVHVIVAYKCLYYCGLNEKNYNNNQWCVKYFRNAGNVVRIWSSYVANTVQRLMCVWNAQRWTDPFLISTHTIIIIYVTGFEKRGHFTQNMIFVTFQLTTISRQWEP